MFVYFPILFQEIWFICSKVLHQDLLLTEWCVDWNGNDWHVWWSCRLERHCRGAKTGGLRGKDNILLNTHISFPIFQPMLTSLCLHNSVGCAPGYFRCWWGWSHCCSCYWCRHHAYVLPPHPCPEIQSSIYGHHHWTQHRKHTLHGQDSEPKDGINTLCLQKHSCCIAYKVLWKTLFLWCHALLLRYSFNVLSVGFFFIHFK